MNNNAFLSLELCLFFVVLMAHFPPAMSQYTELEGLEAVLALKSYLPLRA